MGYLVALALATGFALPVAVLSAAIAQGMVGGSAMSAIARQPEASGKIQLAMIICLALIESLAIYALLVFFLLSGKLPDAAQVIQALAK